LEVIHTGLFNFDKLVTYNSIGDWTLD
jgi:hypothetical protein